MSESNKLSQNELSVLRHLEHNARITLTALGKKTRKSQQRVSYTVNALQRKGILKGFYALIDYSKLSVLHFRVYFKLSYISEQKLHTFINYLTTRQDTGFITTCGGNYDLICTFFSKNVSQFNKNLRGIVAEFPEQIHEFTILTTIVIRRLDRDYLFHGSQELREFFIGGDREEEPVDLIDKTILSYVSQNARVNSVEIANALALTPKTVLDRLKKLEQRMIISGYKPLLSLASVGFLAHLLLIRYHNISIHTENKLINFLKAHPNVVSVVKTLGEWDIEITIEVKHPIDFRKIELEIRQKFATFIHEIQTIPLYETYKMNFFPQFILEATQ